MSDWVFVAMENEFPAGDFRVVHGDEVRFGVFNIDGEYYAIEDVCSHDNAPLCGLDPDGEEVVCPRHGARFNIRTGEALTPPAYENVATFPTRINNGMVEVRDNRWD